MGFADFLVIGAIFCVLFLAGWYVYRCGKKGRKCIGCPNGGKCSGNCAGCGK